MTVTRTWDLTDLELKVLWERRADANLPPPFSFISRTPLLDDYEREKYETWQRLQPMLDEGLSEVIETLIRPEVYVVGYAWCDSDMKNPAKRIRVRAARSGARGYAVTQLPGETVYHSGGFTITEIGPHGLADAVVSALPPTGAGHRHNIPIMTNNAEELERLRGGVWTVLEEADLSPLLESERFLNAPATTTGIITVHQGHSKFGPRGILEQYMLWRDMPDDGRYVIVLDHAPVANGIGPTQLTALVGTSIEKMLERLETHWEYEA